MKKNKKIKIGIIGAGLISQICHIPNYIDNNLCEVIALADFRKKLREKVAKKFHIKNTYNSHLELLKNTLQTITIHQMFYRNITCY